MSYQSEKKNYQNNNKTTFKRAHLKQLFTLPGNKVTKGQTGQQKDFSAQEMRLEAAKLVMKSDIFSSEKVCLPPNLGGGRGESQVGGDWGNPIVFR